MKVNGQTIRLESPMTVSDYLAVQQYQPGRVAVELNGVIVRRDRFSVSLLDDESDMEIVQFMGGG